MEYHLHIVRVTDRLFLRTSAGTRRFAAYGNAHPRNLFSMVQLIFVSPLALLLTTPVREPMICYVRKKIIFLHCFGHPTKRIKKPPSQKLYVAKTRISNTFPLFPHVYRTW